jgi:hypothetical protein
MKRPIIVFYHTCINVHRDHAMRILNEQLNDLTKSGLADAAKWIFICVNGPKEDVEIIRKLAPPKAIVEANDPGMWASHEVNTLKNLDIIAEVYPDAYFAYFHMKGLGHPPGSPGHDHATGWRHRMQNVVVNRWRQCVAALDAGYDSVGQWWYAAPNGTYWAGNFWWATAKFINTLPEIDITGHHSGGRYEAEMWIGRGPALPKVKSL